MEFKLIFTQQKIAKHRIRMIQQIKIRIRKAPFLWSALIVAALLFSLISLVNHYCFRTYALDLGLYTNALYDYAHLSWNDSSAFKETAENILADHFDLYLPLFSPLIYLFGTYTLLIVQIVFILIGATGIYRLVEHRFPDSGLKNYALTYFLVFFGIYSALAFDYHSNVVASMLIPWLFLAVDKRQLLRAALLVLAILIGKESLSLWMLFIGIGLCIQYFKDIRLRYFLIGVILFSALYFIVITGYIMPILSNAGRYPHFQYSKLGTNAGEALNYIVSHPVESLRLLFVNHTGLSEFDYVKIELWIFLVLSGFLCLFRPVYLLMLLPIIGQKMYHNNPSVWGINYQYSIEFAPILAIGVFETIAHFKKKNIRILLAVVSIFLAISCSLRLMDQTILYVEKAQIRVYQGKHYKRDFPIDEAYRILKQIPDDVIVCAHACFVPHLALRSTVYQFPIIKDAEYILLSPKEGTYPLTKEQFATEVDQLTHSSEWEAIVQNENFILLKKNSGQ